MQEGANQQRAPQADGDHGPMLQDSHSRRLLAPIADCLEGMRPRHDGAARGASYDERSPPGVAAWRRRERRWRQRRRRDQRPQQHAANCAEERWDDQNELKPHESAAVPIHRVAGISRVALECRLRAGIAAREWHKRRVWHKRWVGSPLASPCSDLRDKVEHGCANHVGAANR